MTTSTGSRRPLYPHSPFAPVPETTAYTLCMAIIHKCDACKKPISGDRTSVDTPTAYNRFEFCKKHGAPILKVLKQYKLIP